MSSIMTVLFPVICLGVIIAGVLIIKHRKALWEDTRARQRRIFGRYAAGAFERIQSSFWIGFVGVFAVLVGVVMLIRYVTLVLF